MNLNVKPIMKSIPNRHTFANVAKIKYFLNYHPT